jgi:polyisoprenoid-binding protein YceI
MKLLPLVALLPAVLLSSVRAADMNVDARRSWVKVDASATGHSFSGSLKKFDARVSGDAATLAPSAASLEWNFADLDTDEAKRDVEMLKWLEHGKWPKGSFQMTKSWTDNAGKTWVQGSLKIHSVSKSVAFPIETAKNGDRISINGLVWIDYRDFGLPIIRSMAVMTVDPKLKISFHLEGETK